MSVEDKPSAQGRELGTELRRRREAIGHTVAEMADRLGWSASKVSRMETGMRNVAEVDVAIYLASCGVPKSEADPVMDLVREGKHGYRFKPHGEKLPDELRTLIFHETTATQIDNYEPIYVPGLTQTEDYARALMRDGGTPDAILEHRVHTRMKRQQLIKRRNPPQLSFCVHEQALRIPVGRSQVMHEQMLHLMFLADRPQCVVNIVPISAGNRGLASTAFELFRYRTPDRALYVQGEAASLFTERKPDINAHQQALARITSVALDAGQSRQFLASLANEYDRAE